MLSLREVLEILGGIICGGAVFSILLVVIGARLLNSPTKNLARPGSSRSSLKPDVNLPDSFGGVPATGPAAKAMEEPLIGSSGFGPANAPGPGAPGTPAASPNADDEHDGPWWEK